MRFLAELGIGLSVVFGIFFVALLAELCYIFFWKGNGSPTAVFSGAADCVNACRTRADTILRTQKEKKKQRNAHRASAAGEFVREASMVGSFGGSYVHAASDFQSDQIDHGNVQIEPAEEADCSSQDRLQNLARLLPHFLFPITEETKEDLERQQQLASSSILSVASITSNLNTVPRAAFPSITSSISIGDMASLHFTPGSASTSPVISADSQAIPSPLPKLSPYAARAVPQIISSSSNININSRASPSTAEMHVGPVAIIGSEGRGFPPLRDDHQGHGRGTESGRTPLQLLFEQSPLLLAPSATMLCKESHLQAACPPQLQSSCSTFGKASSTTAGTLLSPPPTSASYRHRRSLAVLFEESSTGASSDHHNECN